jgi:C-terminal processing protease CtpA/Prc
LNLRRIGLVVCAGAMLGVFVSPHTSSSQQKFDKFKEQQGMQILDEIHNQVKKHYYDPAFHGVDIERVFAGARDQMKGVDVMNKDFAIIGDALDALRDSHTFFIPPPRNYTLDYGFRDKIVRDKCFITFVDPNQHDAKITAGDQLLTINGDPVNRHSLSRLHYLYDTLLPQPSLTLGVQTLAGERKEVEITSEINFFDKTVGAAQMRAQVDQQIKELTPRFREYGDVLILELRSFTMTQIDLDRVVSTIHKHKSLILDLRGNAGGAVLVEQEILRNFFDHQVHIADLVGRDGRKAQNVKGDGGHAFGGKIVVVVDGGSTSASEIVARVLQLEKRATIIGDLTGGKVMVAQTYIGSTGLGMGFPFAISITDADVIMSDGKSLEAVGVTPDEVSVPTAADIAAGRDPVLSRAAALLGVTITPEDAGKLFPYEWPKPAEYRTRSY